MVYIIKVNQDLLEAIDQYEERDFSDEVGAEKTEENET